VLRDASGHIPANVEELLQANVSVGKDAYEVADQAHAVAVMTEWDEFRSLDFSRVYQVMAKPAFIFDGRNILDNGNLAKIGFEVHSIGRGKVE
jgi:UDPglucose 6-dehydrogenase